MSKKTPPSSPKFRTFASPKTPIKAVPVDKDKSCLICSEKFVSGSKQSSFYNVNISKGFFYVRIHKRESLRERIEHVIGKSPNYNKEYVRVCKKCYRKVESLE